MQEQAHVEDCLPRADFNYLEGEPTTMAGNAGPSATDTTRPFRAFISYTTDPDYRLSQRAESFLETFHRLKLPSGVELAPIQICRDGSDFSLRRALREGTPGTIIEDLIASYLADADYLIVLCSSGTPRSHFVDFEVRWFIENRGPEYVLLAVTEGDDPSAQPEVVFPRAVIEGGLQRKPFFDLRGFNRKLAKNWTKVRDPEEELAGLAAFLHGDTSGRLLPIWQREIVRKARRQRMIFAAATIVLATIAGFALWERRVADSARVRAERALAESQARSLVLGGEESIEKDPQLSLLLALEAARIGRDGANGFDARISSLLVRSVLATPERIGRDLRGVECFAISPDGKVVAIGTQTSGVVTLSLGDGRVLRHYRSKDWVNAVDWSDDGRLLAVGARDDTVVIWNAATGSRREVVKFKGEPQSVDWRASSRELAVGLGDGDRSRTVVWDEARKRDLFDVPGIIAAWSPDGRLLASGGFAGRVRIFTAAGKQLANLSGHRDYVGKIVWRPDGHLFATASVDNHVIVWDASKRRQVVKLSADFPLSAAWRNDGKELASGSGDQFVTVWRAPRFKKLLEITKASTITGEQISSSGAAGYVLDVSWSRDGKRFLVADRESGILVYAASLLDAKTVADWELTARAQLRRTLTPQEARKFGLPVARG